MANGIGFEPGDDICPPWWPHWWRRTKTWPPRAPKEFEKFEQFHLILTIHELASQLQDPNLAKGIQSFTAEGARTQAATLPMGK